MPDVTIRDVFLALFSPAGQVSDYKAIGALMELPITNHNCMLTDRGA